MGLIAVFFVQSPDFFPGSPDFSLPGVAGKSVNEAMLLMSINEALLLR